MSKCICDSLDLFKGGCTCGFTEATEEAANEALASPDEGEGEDEILTCDCGCGATYNPSIEAAKCNLQMEFNIAKRHWGCKCDVDSTFHKEDK